MQTLRVNQRIRKQRNCSRRDLDRRNDALETGVPFPARHARGLLDTQPRMLKKLSSARTLCMIDIKRLCQEICRFCRDVRRDRRFSRLTNLWR